MRHRFLLLAALVSATACGTEPEPALGPLAGAIVEGNNQAVTAGTAALPNPVAYQVVRLPNGTVAIRRVPRWEQLLLPKIAHAQTTVNGSPVPGAVVCAQEVPDLIPFSRCTNTDNNGKAVFHFNVSAKAGQHRSEIRGSLNNQPAVFDTVKATVNAAAPDSSFRADNIANRASPAVFLTQFVMDKYGNHTPYRLAGDARVTPSDTVLGSEGARTLTFTASSVDSTWRSINVTGASGTIARMSYRLVYSDFGVGGSGMVPRIQAVICGLGVNPCTSTNHAP